MDTEYVAQVPITHSVTGEQYDPGEIVPVGHLSPEDIEKLVQRGILREAALPPKTPPSAPARPAPRKDADEVSNG